MKKVILRALFVLLILVLVSCTVPISPPLEDDPIVYTTPIIEVDGNSLLTYYAGVSVTVPTFSVADDYEDLTSSVQIKVVNEAGEEQTLEDYSFIPSVAGTYTVTYSVTNMHDLSTSQSVTLTVQERPDPVLTVGELAETVQEGNEVVLPTAEANDTVDLDLTSAIEIQVKDPEDKDVTIENGKFVATVPGTYTILYKVSNSALKEASTTKTISCTAIQYVLESTQESIGEQIATDTITLPVVTVKDYAELAPVLTITLPDASTETITTETYKLTQVGTYVFTYTYGNATPIVYNVIVKEADCPVLNVVTEGLPTYYEGATVAIPSYSAQDTYEGDIHANVTYVVTDPSGNTVEVSEGAFTAKSAGTYTIAYSVSNKYSKSASKTAEIVVSERPNPVLTVGDFFESYEEGSEISLPTMEASDTVDGTLTSSIEVSVKDPNGQDVSVAEGKFTASIPGTYTVVFKVTNTGLKEASVTKTFTCTEKQAPTQYVLESAVESVGTCYVNQVFTFPVVSVKDHSEATPVLTMTLPNESTVIVSDATYTFASAGSYKLSYAYDNATPIEYTFEVKAEFVIGWDARMYTAAISTMTKTIAESYKAYVEGKLAGTAYKDVTISLLGFDQAVYLDLGTAINNAKCDIIVGFTSTTFNAADAETNPCGVVNVSVKYGTIAQATKRCIAQLVSSDMAKAVYEESITEDGFASLDVKQLVVGWFSNNATTEARMTAVETALESYFTGLGYTIDVISKLYTKSSTVTYTDIHNQMIADEVVIGFNWGSNFNSASAFNFTSARLQKGIQFGNTTGRYITSMIKYNNIYEFYNTLFDYIIGEDMLAVYKA